MRKIHKYFAVIALLFFSAVGMTQAEQIDSFDAIIKINPDASVSINESIVYDFGQEEKHGIFRYIPLAGPEGNLRITDIEVTDEQGVPYEFDVSTKGSRKAIKIGDPDRTVSGRKLYIISYRVDDVLESMATNTAQFYWNITGNEWPVAIKSARAKLVLPAPIDSKSIGGECFYGEVGSQTACKLSLELGEQRQVQNLEFNSAAGIDVQGMTIRVKFPESTIARPGLWLSYWQYLLSYPLILLPLLVIAVMYNIWTAIGRDPKGGGVIIAQYEAPENLTPIALGAIMDESVDNLDFSSEIIYLATRGYLKINSIKKEGVVFDSQDYLLESLKDYINLENDYDKKLMAAIFRGENSTTLSAIPKEGFATAIKELRKQVMTRLVEQGYFKSNPLAYRIAAAVTGPAMAFVAIFFLSGIDFYGLSWGVLISAPIMSLFLWIMPARTLKGVKIREQILGFKDYLQTAEKDRIDFVNAPAKNPATFEKYLPFAMMLKVEKEWAGKFEGLYNHQPTWYGNSSHLGFQPLALSNDLHLFGGIASSYISSAVSSGSHGGSRGGFSGGGFGGGGGGSW